MAALSVGAPTTGGITKGLTNYAMGAIGGLVFNLSGNLLGNIGLGGGLVGGALTAALASSVMRGDVGNTISTIAGFQALSGGLGSNLFGGGGGTDDGIEVM